MVDWCGGHTDAAMWTAFSPKAEVVHLLSSPTAPVWPVCQYHTMILRHNNASRLGMVVMAVLSCIELEQCAVAHAAILTPSSPRPQVCCVFRALHILDIVLTSYSVSNLNTDATILKLYNLEVMPQA